MRSILDQTPAGARVAVILLRSIGDCVLSTPALAILKRARPDLKVAVVVEEQYAALFDGNPDVHRILPPAARELRDFRPSLCLNLHGGPASMALTLLSGSQRRAGFDHLRPAMVYNVRIPPAQQVLGISRKVHAAEEMAAAVFFLGAPKCEVPRARLFAHPPDGRGNCVVFHPFAGPNRRSWPAGNFLQVARSVSDEMGLIPVFIAGSDEDLAPFREFHPVAGIPLSALLSLISGSQMFVGMDGGLCQIAAAFGVPVVAFFGNLDPAVWAPWRTATEILPAGRSMESISPQQVLSAISRLRGVSCEN